MQRKPTSWRGLRQGFTIVELMVIIVVLVILVGIVGLTANDYQERARDGERAVDTEIIAKSLERYYRTQAVAVGASYPSTITSAATLASITDSIDATLAPSETTNSIVVATTNAAQTPTISQYVYQPLNLDDSLCTEAPCVRFKLYYRLELTDEVMTISSVRQQ